MAEVFLIGEIVGASGFPHTELCCKYSFEIERDWELREGIPKGQTQVDVPRDGGMTIWSQPIDLHYSCHNPMDWPKIVFQVFHLDSYGRYDLEGYGFCSVPSTPGMHSIDVVTWRPAGNLREQMSEFFVGGVPQLKNDKVIHLCTDRNRLRTQSAGVIHLSLGVVLKDFQKYGVMVSAPTPSAGAFAAAF
ncbi:hypothetical protein PAPYR_13538 [Paratrimastix pyriformis]|uniref:B9 domain-containing protein 2 n=1 Tax=Paratrimastix pyriformis TaxID=342808 RepID=A0ABQ8UVC2_9EUKA|nr:hypothetical protein PAPYR_13538 [Paratrimastix pyriformis]